VTSTAFPAGHYREGRLGDVDLAVLHTSEVLVSRFQLAKSMANSDRAVSCHSIVDAQGRLDVLPFTDTAYAAPGANADGDQLEVIGLSKWSRATWLRSHRPELEQTARWLADRCRARRLPVVLLGPAELRADRRGITTHAAVSAAFHRSTHTDPGSGFPLDTVLARVKVLLTARPTPLPTRAVPPYRGMLTVGSHGDAVTQWQRQMRRRGWAIEVDGAYGEQSATIAATFQHEKGLHVDGKVGRETWAATWSSPVT
jgi:N-acetyl-anhydromuramyl-L-alanine amidase AmpD